MKSLMFVLLATFSVSAQADEDSGLNCFMEYSQSQVLSNARLVTSRSLVAGESMAGEAMAIVDDGRVGDTPAHYVKVTNVKVSGKTFWQVQVLDSGKEPVAAFSFRPEAGMRVVLPVDAIANESEDPPRYDTLQVTCKFNYFAG